MPDGSEPAVFHYIGIDILHPGRKDTLVDRHKLKATQKEDKCDVSIHDDYNMPLKSINKKLIKRWGEKRKF